ncbi:MAG TPA: DegT/DnrJ/EryC1/StrS family aminotransferase, partial [Mycobacteriales bacterium]|nr:DegT/DnrJ/EryC1/StrS family aminotransferase [Mycobacteriales bacterium]
MSSEAVTVLGGAGFIGSAVARRAAAGGRPVVSLDRVRQEPPRLPPSVEQRQLDLLVDPLAVPDGLLVIALGGSDPPGGAVWRIVLDQAVTTARALPALRGRDVVLVSSVEAGLVPDDPAIEAWCAELLLLARRPCPPWQVAELCRSLVAADPTGSGTLGLAARAQELLVRSVVDPARLTVLRAADVFGPGQDGVVARLARRALAGLPLRVPDAVRTLVPVDDLAAVALAAEPGTLHAGLDSLPLPSVAALVLDTLGSSAPVSLGPPAADVGPVGTDEFRRRLGVGDGRERLLRELRSFVGRLATDDGPAFVPALPVVLPPKPRRPDEVAVRTLACLETGAVRGGPWATRLADGLREALALPPESALLVVSSGSAALRLAVQAIAGPVRPGDVAVLPSFTFAATGEMLAQLGYTLRFCDVHPDTWTMDPASLTAALAPGDVTVVVAVDALGAPA